MSEDEGWLSSENGSSSFEANEDEVTLSAEKNVAASSSVEVFARRRYSLGWMVQHPET